MGQLFVQRDISNEEELIISEHRCRRSSQDEISAGVFFRIRSKEDHMTVMCLGSLFLKGKAGDILDNAYCLIKLFLFK